MEHVCFYLDVLEGALLNEKAGQVDWDEIWRTAGPVIGLVLTAFGMLAAWFAPYLMFGGFSSA
jgi:hypothetical protein